MALNKATRDLLEESLEAIFNLAPSHYRTQLHKTAKTLCFNGMESPCRCTPCKIRTALET